MNTTQFENRLGKRIRAIITRRRYRRQPNTPIEITKEEIETVTEVTGGILSEIQEWARETGLGRDAIKDLVERVVRAPDYPGWDRIIEDPVLFFANRGINSICDRYKIE
ncbi:hypothetical protein [Rosistilla oblonga]|uniref:hypothetical protein n=1 Tax=Rosistilla oblonga TaxID=2527990 RepID=UPI003A98308E